MPTQNTFFSASILVHTYKINLTKKEMPETMKRLQNLTTFQAKHNNLLETSYCFGGLTNLLEFDGQYNNIHTLSNNIGQLKVLQDLNLSRNSIDILPCEIGFLTNLRNLNLKCNQIRVIPIEIGALVCLQSLDISHNRLEDSNGEKMNGVAKQNNNNCTCLPNELCLLRSLETLNLSYNRMTRLPRSIGALFSLHHMDICHNQIDTIPTSAKELSQLTVFLASSNCIKNFSKHFCLQWNNLRRLDLSSNRIRYLPREISCLSRDVRNTSESSSPLIQLNFYHNDLFALPVEIAHLLNRFPHVEIDVRENPFYQIPFKYNSCIKGSRWCRDAINSTGASISGYTNSEVLEWVREEAIWYDFARDEWEDTAAWHMCYEHEGGIGDNGLGFKQFLYGNYDGCIKGLLTRMANFEKKNIYFGNEEKDGEESMEDFNHQTQRRGDCGETNVFASTHAFLHSSSCSSLSHKMRLKQFYYKCRKDGVVPRYDELTEQERMERKQVIHNTKQKRLERAQEARERDELRNEEVYSRYYNDLELRMRHAQQHTKNHEMKKKRQDLTSQQLQKEREEEEKQSAFDLIDQIHQVTCHEEEPTNKIKRTLPLETLPCWKSKTDTLHQHLL
uniref:Uncharacterized protein n=1 Tax=Ditylum brightwellii TaxID=49249 RepID=A0A7S4VDQ1_9STRA